jgi:hypothetical protein
MIKAQQSLAKLCRIAVLSAMAITPALAVDVTYNTTGSFGGGSNVSTGANGLTITYGNTVGDSVSGPYPTNASFGTFTVIDPTAGSTDVVNTNFSLTITQTGPTAGAETLVDTFSGTIRSVFVNGTLRGNSNVVLKFTGGSGTGGAPILASDPIDGATAYSFSLGGVIYYIDRVTPIEPQTTNGGVSTINGAIDASAVPEPSFYALTGIGFFGLMLMAVSRRRQSLLGRVPVS